MAQPVLDPGAPGATLPGRPRGSKAWPAPHSAHSEWPAVTGTFSFRLLGSVLQQYFPSEVKLPLIELCARLCMWWDFI